MAYKDSADLKAWHLEHADKMRAYRKAWRLAHPEWKRASRIGDLRRWEAANPERGRVLRIAYKKVERALHAGTLVRPAECEECGAGGRIEAAHSDYAKPLEVRWLCRPCHSRWDTAQPKSPGGQ